ncbi:MAG: 12,18-didecarboxysiroheme deacetylase [Deltaproteobacteria bacterium]|nr:12,18-didecarboxysiroheme deacetylase [Deltaproteobacteria bacterium]
MIGISKLYCGTVEASDLLRYGRDSKKLPAHLLQFSADKKPVVVFNVTNRCNLKCLHCYAQAADRPAPDELTTGQALALLDDLARFGTPVVLFSGGEPLLRPDLNGLIGHAVGLGLRAVISTNGTLITRGKAAELKTLGLSYVGISLDGLEEANDRFRQVEGAFKAALRGIDNCQEAGLKVGLRFTISRRNTAEVPKIFDLMEERRIPRVCFYHLVYAGRGSALIEEALEPEETRAVVDLILDRTKQMHQAGHQAEVLTVDNHCDGPYLYLRLLKEDPRRAAGVLKLLEWNQGNNTGRGIGCVSWDGSVHPDQFWRHLTLGNVLERPFSEIWTDESIDILRQLRQRQQLLKGRCAECQWLSICNGNFRVRAEALTGDLWAPDPACYLTDREIGLERADQAAG